MEIVSIFLQAIFLLGCGWHCYTDYKELLLYDSVSFVMLLAGGIYNWYMQDLYFLGLGTIATGGAFLLLFMLCPKGVGFGDVKLAFVLGCWLGWQKGLFSLLLALWLGFSVGMFLLLGSYKGIKDAIPFGPYMCVSGVIMLYFGEQILSWYISLF